MAYDVVKCSGGGATPSPRLLFAGLLAATAVVGCSTPQAGPPPLPAPTEMATCPLPLFRGSDGYEARRLRLKNEIGRALSVYVDHCNGHRLIGEAPADQTVFLALPPTVYPYGDYLRLHAYTDSPRRRHGCCSGRLERRTDSRIRTRRSC